MLGYITTPETSAAITEAIALAQTSRNLPVFWLIEGIPILQGEHVGKHFIPVDEAVLSTPLRGNPINTPRDFPEFDTLITMLGGLDARIDLDTSFLILPPHPII